jgi:hypothetical protein
MDAFKKLSLQTQLIMIGLAVYIILSFFDWQSVDTPLGSFGVSEWHGFMGTVTVLVAIVWLAWEIATRLANVKISTGPVTHEFTGAGIAVLFGVLTVILFFVKNEYRAWPEWIGTIIALCVSIIGIQRAREEGVTVDQAKAHMSAATSAMGSSASSAETSPSSPPPASSSPSMGDAVEEPAPDEPSSSGEGDRPSSSF